MPDRILEDVTFSLNLSAQRTNDYRHLEKDKRSLEIERGVQNRLLDEMIHLRRERQVMDAPMPVRVYEGRSSGPESHQPVPA